MSMSIDQIRAVAPSAFATKPWHEVSSKYAFIPTVSVIEEMMNTGFNPVSATQSLTRIDGKGTFTKHMIRFRPQEFDSSLGMAPEAVLINSHDRSSRFKMLAGLGVFACENGLIVASDVIGSINVMHSGNIIQEVTRAAITIIERMPIVLETAGAWKQIDLTEQEQGIFAESAYAIRFADSDGVVTDNGIQPWKLLTPRRTEDTGPDLWSVFNRVQENAVKGGLRGYDTQSHRRVRSRAVKSIDTDVRLNKALWTLAEKMAALKQEQAA